MLIFSISMDETRQDFLIAKNYNFQKTVTRPPVRFSIYTYVPS